MIHTHMPVQTLDVDTWNIVRCRMQDVNVFSFVIFIVSLLFQVGRSGRASLGSVKRLRLGSRAFSGDNIVRFVAAPRAYWERAARGHADFTSLKLHGHWKLSGAV
ncbi:hypothetical protein D9619_009827 [Psilocybe cf. subviscida]|uniref:Uncharacterized protein n=1 Tax=Psilocybe cf. subviscida TaxID=2480587 RepID=A0A8H5F698_9AGAR|nr:hypothetical protein D9619_009827 [Psilocybe cf. subviscida]